MKILHIVPGLDPKSGGPTRSITGLCRGLALRHVDTHLYVVSPEHELWNPSGVSLHKGQGARWPFFRKELVSVILQERPSIMHLHGLWMALNHEGVRLATRHDIPIMVSTRGMLDPWALDQKPFKKRLAMGLYQRRDLARVACFHATADQEARNIRAQNVAQPVCVIPNGVDLPQTLPKRRCRADGRKTALFLSRLHPGKGLMDLVPAWSASAPSGWVMRVVGPDVCGHKAEVVSEVDRRGLQNAFEFIGELDDSEKWQEYVNADLFVHPSHSENFGISIAEALAAGLPVITTKGTPWQELDGSSCHSSLIHECVSSLVGTDQKSEIGSQKSEVLCTNVRKNLRTNELACTERAGWWIDIGAEPLAEALREAMGLSDEERRAMGENGRKLVEAKYTWPAIAEQMKAAYEWVLNGGPLPPCVRVS